MIDIHNDIQADASRKQMTIIPSTTSMPRALVMLFAGASGLSVANVYYAQPLLDAISVDFAISHAAVGAVIAATQAGCALSLLLLVPLGDRLDRRQLMLSQLFGLIVALTGVGFSMSASALLLGMLAVGLLGTAMTQGLIAYAAAVAAPAERGRIVGAAQGGVVIGLLLARVVAGMISDLTGWRGVYFFSALMMLGLAFLLWRALPRKMPSSVKLTYSQLIISMFTLLIRERVLQIRGVIALLMFSVFSILWSVLVLPLSAAPYSFSHTLIGTFGLAGAVGALGATRAGRLADRGLGQWTSGFALLLLLVSWIPLWFTTSSLWFLLIGIVILDLGGQAVHVTNQSMIFESQTEAHSRLVGCYMLFYSIGSGLGALGSTEIYAILGWNGVCLLGAGISALALMFWGITLRHMPAAAKGN
jgi:predicted MFS family arabinose efflux permease